MTNQSILVGAFDQRRVDQGWQRAVGELRKGYAAFVAIDSYAGRTPVGEIVELASPLRGGPYLVVSGGSTKSVNTHVLTLFPFDDEMAAYRGQSFAVDLVKIDGFGLRARGLRPRDPSAYYIFGEPLYAPATVSCCTPRMVILTSTSRRWIGSICPAITSSWRVATTSS
jgi:hypothetical protein